MSTIVIRSGLLLLAALIAAAAQAQTSTYVLQDARLIDGTGKPARDHVSILISQGRIAKISAGKLSAPGATVVNLSGKTVMPGIINGHGHLGLTKGAGVSPDITRKRTFKANLLNTSDTA